MQTIVELAKNFYTVHKFGGSSVADASRFIEVTKILNGSKEIIVVSATKGTTTKLQNMLDAARDGHSWKMDLANLEQMHQLISGSRLHVIDDIAHQWHPHIAETVRDFLASALQ